MLSTPSPAAVLVPNGTMIATVTEVAPFSVRVAEARLADDQEAAAHNVDLDRDRGAGADLDERDATTTATEQRPAPLRRALPRHLIVVDADLQADLGAAARSLGSCWSAGLSVSDSIIMGSR